MRRRVRRALTAARPATSPSETRGAGLCGDELRDKDWLLASPAPPTPVGRSVLAGRQRGRGRDERRIQNRQWLGESDCLIKTKHFHGSAARWGVDGMWFLPSALNVKVKKFEEARVNGGSKYDSLCACTPLWTSHPGVQARMLRVFWGTVWRVFRRLLSNLTRGSISQHTISCPNVSTNCPSLHRRPSTLNGSIEWQDLP